MVDWLEELLGFDMDVLSGSVCSAPKEPGSRLPAHRRTHRRCSGLEYIGGVYVRAAAHQNSILNVSMG